MNHVNIVCEMSDKKKLDLKSKRTAVTHELFNHCHRLGGGAVVIETLSVSWRICIFTKAHDLKLSIKQWR